MVIAVDRVPAETGGPVRVVSATNTKSTVICIKVKEIVRSVKKGAIW